MTDWNHSGQLDRFREPDFWHRTANYWFWHRIPTDQEITEQLEAMRSAGYGSFQVAVRMSWPLAEYLSDEYLAAVRRTADAARALGLHMGIYDEYSWLSGHAGGRTVAGRDELREQHLFWSSGVLRNGEAILTVSGIHATDVDWLLEPGANWVFENGVPEWADWEIQGAYLRSGIGGGNSQDVTEQAEFVEVGAATVTIRMLIPGGSDGDRVSVAVSGRCSSSRMINYLDPAAAKRFTEVGLQPYADVLGDHMGDTVAYVFFDQPHASFWDWTERTGSLSSAIMYAPVLRDAVERELPGGWRSLLPVLIDAADDSADAEGQVADAARARAAFFALYARLGTTAFLGTVARWCHDHGVLLSGHEVLAHVGSWDLSDVVIADDARPNFGMDYFAIDSFRDITGVDARNNVPQLSAKFGDSVARAHGRSGCIVEQYYGRVEEGTHFGAGQWELTLGSMRAQAIRHHLLGARQFLEHAFWLTDGDDRDGMSAIFVNPRFDFPPGMNFEPWFGFHEPFARESASLSQFLDEFEPHTDVALVYPLTTIAGYGPTHPVGRHFAAWAETMSRYGVQYRIVNEAALATAVPTEHGIRIGDAEYRAIVLAAVELVSSQAITDVLHEARVRGVLVTGSGPAPGGLASAGWALDVPTTDEILSLLTPLADASRPAVTAVDRRTLWARTGSDASGAAYLAAFNDDVTPTDAVLTLPSGDWTITEWNVSDGTIRSFRGRGTVIHRLEAQQVFCLTLEQIVAVNIILDDGWMLSTPTSPARPIRVDSSWESQEVDDRGEIATYALSVTVPEGHWALVLDELDAGIEVRFDGATLGRRGWPPYRFGFWSDGDNVVLLEIDVAASAANRYYGDSSLRGATRTSSGIITPPRLEGTAPETDIGKGTEEHMIGAQC